MHYIDERTVELTAEEQRAYNWFHSLLDGGADCRTAGRETRAAFKVSDEFIEWLVN